MSLRLLLDEHISPEIARQLSKKAPGLSVVPMRDWHQGRFMGTADQIWIPEMIKDGLTLVTYDRVSITPLLRDLADQGINHSGVVFVDEKSIAQSNFGLITKALHQLWLRHRKAAWGNRVVYLKA